MQVETPDCVGGMLISVIWQQIIQILDKSLSKYMIHRMYSKYYVTAVQFECSFILLYFDIVPGSFALSSTAV